MSLVYLYIRVCDLEMKGEPSEVPFPLSQSQSQSQSKKERKKEATVMLENRIRLFCHSNKRRKLISFTQGTPKLEALILLQCWWQRLIYWSEETMLFQQLKLILCLCVQQRGRWQRSRRGGRKMGARGKNVASEIRRMKKTRKSSSSFLQEKPAV